MFDSIRLRLNRFMKGGIVPSRWMRSEKGLIYTYLTYHREELMEEFSHEGAKPLLWKSLLSISRAEGENKE